MRGLSAALISIGSLVVRAVNLLDGQLTLRVLSGLLFSGHHRLREQGLGLKGTAAEQAWGGGRGTNGRQRTSLSRKKKRERELERVTCFRWRLVRRLRCLLPVCGLDQ